MMNKSRYLFRQVIQFSIYMALQLLLAQSVIAITYVCCFVYVGIFLLLFKQRIHLPLQLLLAFGLGFLMDAWYETWGIHAAASVLVVYLKAILSKILVPASGSSAMKPSLTNMGFANFSIFLLILLFIHHATVFFLEAWNSGLWLFSLQKAFLSTLFTYLLIFIMQALSALFVNHRSS